MSVPEPPDSRRLVAQETAALTPVLRAVIAAVLRESRNHADIDDAMQEVLRRAVEGRARLREGEPLRPWVIGIARHVALDAVRKRGRDRSRMVSSSPSSEDESRPNLVEQLADSSPSPYESLANVRDKERVIRALDKLSEGPREALRLFHLEGLEYQQIASRMDVPLGTVATWVTRARKSLAAAIAEEHQND